MKVMARSILTLARRIWLSHSHRTSFRFMGLRVTVFDSVLNPSLFTSSKVFAKVVANWLPRKTCRVLELGCGCGLASMVAARVGHTVTAVDLNPEAVRNSVHNMAINQLSLQALLSDWDQQLPKGEVFDVIICNPPFLSGSGGAMAMALRAGDTHDVFRRLVQAIQRRLAPGGKALVMTSSQTNRAAWLEAVDDAQELSLQLLCKPRHWQERLIFDQISRSSSC